MFKKALAAAVLLVAVSAFAATLAEDTITELYAMKSIYNAQYAPAAWKKQYASYDLETEVKKGIAAVQSKSQLSIADTRKVFSDFVYAMKDYHVSVQFNSTESATLPLRVKGAEGRLFLVDVDRTKLSNVAFPFQLGDELVTIDGRSANDVVTDVQQWNIANVDVTDRALAEMRLFRRSGASGYKVPKGPVTLGLRRKGETLVREVQLLWNYSPEKVAPRGTFSTSAIAAALLKAKTNHFAPKMTVAFAGLEPSFGVYDLGARQSFIPDLGKKEWESAADVEFYAYTFTNADGKRIGYVRIPGYTPDDAAKAVKDMATILQKFQAETDSLVIDQVNNPGGSVFYLYALASLMTDQPLITPRHRMTVTQADVVDALNMIAQLDQIKTEDDVAKAVPSGEMGGYPVSLEFIKFMKSYAQFLVDEWNAGRSLTEPYWIAGVDKINPGVVQYTKPTMIIVNELDFSGGDFFPTIMQDNKRVKVFGTRTAGAGGYINSVQIPNNVGIAGFSITGSIAERVNGQPIENLGVTPDVAYSMTADDVQNGYQGYVKAILEEVKKQTP
ncbi:MAG: protease-like activity factor CPAF [Bdellovibrionota bacterium]